MLIRTPWAMFSLTIYKSYIRMSTHDLELYLGYMGTHFSRMISCITFWCRWYYSRCNSSHIWFSPASLWVMLDLTIPSCIFFSKHVKKSRHLIVQQHQSEWWSSMIRYMLWGYFRGLCNTRMLSGHPSNYVDNFSFLISFRVGMDFS